jgi:mono/diheme cytochrome c family protein
MMNGWGSNGGQYPVIPQATPNANVSFQSNVLPIFREDCTACHGATAGLSLDSYANAMKGGRSGVVIVPGDPNNSRLIQYVVRGYMPFNGQPLSAAEIQTLINWVAAGARDN